MGGNLRRRTAVPLTLAERRKRYEATPRGKYTKHKKNARRRGIAFELTYEQWLGIWKRSGHWHERGNGKADDYVMARKGDSGPYAVRNVEIITHAANVATRNTLYTRPSFVGAAARYRRRNGEPGPDVPF